MAGIFRCNSSNATPGRRVTLSPFCTSPGQLQDVTMDNYSVGYRSPCISLQHNGTTSPGQGRSVREFEEQMASLKKENFNLRLRIYFLEEKLSGGYNQMSTPEGQESLMKQYIDNKVETEILLKDVDEKQKLLVEAAQAMTHMENMQKDTETKNQEKIDELLQRIQFLEMENKELENATNCSNDILAPTQDINSLHKVRELEGIVRQFEDKNDELNIQITEFQQQLNEKNDIIQEIESKIKQLNFQNAELQEQIENKENEIVTTTKKSVELNIFLSEKEILNNQLKERNEILLNENKQLLKTVETRTQDLANQTKCFEEKNIKIQQQQNLMNDMHSTILNKRKQLTQLSEQLEKSENKYVDYDNERKSLQKENIILKNIIIDGENKKQIILKHQQQQQQQQSSTSSSTTATTTSSSRNNIFTVNDISENYLTNPLFFVNSYPNINYQNQSTNDNNNNNNKNSEFKLKEKLDTFQNPSFYYRETKNYHEINIEPREKINNNNKYIDLMQENNGQEKVSIHLNRTVESFSKAIIKNDNNNIDANNCNHLNNYPQRNIVASLFVPSNYFTNNHNNNNNNNNNNIRGSNSDTSLSTCNCCSSSTTTTTTTATTLKNSNLPLLLRSNHFFDKNNNYTTTKNFKKFTNPELIQETLNHEFKIQKLRDELHEYKVKYADKTCLVDDLEDEINKEKMSNEQACKTIQKLLITIKEMENEYDKLKKNSPDNNISQVKESTFGSNSTALFDSLNATDEMCNISVCKQHLDRTIQEKNLQLKTLEDEIKNKSSNVQTMINKELWEKNRAIECLSKLLNKLNSTSSPSPVNQVNTEQLQQSSDLEYSAAIIQNKILQKKIDKLLQKLNSIEPIEIIEQLKSELHDAQLNAEEAHKWRKECAEGCAVLTQRLEELAGFLDSLLQHKDVFNCLASDRRRAMRKAIDRSLDLSRSMNNMSMSISGLSLNETSLIQLSNISGILASNNTDNKENKNKTFNSHEELNQINLIADNGTQSQVEILKAQVKALKKELEKQKLNEPIKKDRKSLPLKLEMQSESEAWSEPDRNVSFARIGLEELNTVPKIKKSLETENNSSTGSETDINRRSKSKTLEKINLLEEIITQKDNKILEIQSELVDADNRLKKDNLKMLDINQELSEYRNVKEILEQKIATFENKSLDFEKFKIIEETLRREIVDKSQYIEKIQEDRNKLNVEAKVAAIQMETLKNEIDELKLKHEKNLELLKDEEKNKFNQLNKELQTNLEHKLKEQESKHQEYLQRDWISRLTYEDTRRYMELLRKKLDEAQSRIDNLNVNEAELKANLIEHEKELRSLKKTLDETTLTASKAVLERTKATSEKLKLEDRLQEMIKEIKTAETEKLTFKERIIHLEKANNNLCKKLFVANATSNIKTDKILSISGSDVQSGYTSEEIPNNDQKPLIAHEQRLENSSPDLGIESDPGRVCITEKLNLSKTKCTEIASQISNDQDNINGNDTNKENQPQTNEILSEHHECAKVFQENIELRHKLKRTRRLYEDTLKFLRTGNQKKEQVERDIRQQIVKTHVVLKNIRNNMETELQLPKQD